MKARQQQTQANDLDFAQWLRRYRSEFSWDYPHFRAMRGLLDQITSGKIRRSYFQIPIRHGKTEHNTIAYASYRLWLNPRLRIVITSYNATRAEKFSREVRRLSRSVGVQIAADKKGAKEWETLAGGSVLAVGAGAGVASVNADLILIDDPIGSRADAESPALRDTVWEWLTSDILARCEPHTAVTMTMSRWHPDDPAGRLRDRMAGQWEVLDLPGEAEANDPLGRAVGEALWPEFRPKSWLEEKKIELLPYGYASLIQGRPRPAEGGMFNWDDWRLTDSIPAVGPMVRYWDLAGTEPTGDNDPDWCVGSLLCRTEDLRTFVVDVCRFRASIGERDTRMKQVALEDMRRFPDRVRWWVEQEAGIGGKDRTKHILRMIQDLGMPMRAEAATASKEIRAEPLASAVGCSNVYLCPGDWRDPLRLEAADFPQGKHDDIVDSLSGAYNKLSGRGVVVMSGAKDEQG